MYTRKLLMPQKYHCILFGARGTGKTTLLKDIFPSETTIIIDLLNLKVEDKYPDSLAEVVNALSSEVTHIVIDEIQKLPKLLDVVHTDLVK